MGEGDLVGSKKLNELIEKTSGSLDVVFVAACDSEFVGKIFLRCGAKHVICVKKDRFVLDQAAIAFTEMFYTQIIQKGLSICEAFAHAKAFVEYKYEQKEADLFIKFTEEQLVEFESMGAVRAKPHACYAHPCEASGEYQCISDHIQFKQIPEKLSNLKNRDKEVWEITKNITSGKRLVFIFGLHGTGKSTIVRQALQYICDRKFFTGGVIQIQLSNVKSTYSLMKAIQRAIIKGLNLTKDQLNEIIEDNCSEDRLFDMITYFFNNNLKYPILKDKHSTNKSHKYLLYFDNAEELISYEWKKSFSFWISKILDECNLLSIVMTSKKGILPDELSKLSIPPEVQYLK